MKRQLTDKFCASAKAREGEPQTDYFDTQVSGLALRVSKWGRKGWTLHYTLGGKRRRLTLGAYPSISLWAARTRTDETKATLGEGRDPSLAMNEERPALRLTNRTNHAIKQGALRPSTAQARQLRHGTTHHS